MHARQPVSISAYWWATPAPLEGRGCAGLGMIGRFLVHGRAAARMLLRIPDRGSWVEVGVLGCAYPRNERALSMLEDRGVRVLVNLYEIGHEPRLLERHGMREVHVPARDFSAPPPDLIERSVNAIVHARSAGEAVAVHCGGGLGRTGTVLACYLVRLRGVGAEEAVRRVREIRPGSVETRSQREAVQEFARRMPSG